MRHRTLSSNVINMRIGFQKLCEAKGGFIKRHKKFAMLHLVLDRSTELLVSFCKTMSGFAGLFLHECGNLHNCPTTVWVQSKLIWLNAICKKDINERYIHKYIKFNMIGKIT